MRLIEIHESAYQPSEHVDADIEKYFDVIKQYKERGVFIFRGMKETSRLIFGDGNQLNRKSANTANTVNFLTSVLPSWQGWPVRTKSFICSSVERGADGYGSLYCVIPLENQNVAWLKSTIDFWDAYQYADKKMSKVGNIPNFNRFIEKFSETASKKNINTRKELFTCLKEILEADLSISSAKLANFYEEFIGDSKTPTEILYKWNDIFDPAKIANISPYDQMKPIKENREVWLSGKVLFIHNSLLD